MPQVPPKKFEATPFDFKSNGQSYFGGKLVTKNSCIHPEQDAQTLGLLGKMHKAKYTSSSYFFRSR